jgi:hypothetical protein
MALIAYLFKIDEKKWAAFKARLSREGHTVKWIIESLIDDYITHGRVKPEEKKKKDKPDA